MSITIFGIELPLYGIMFFLGIAAAAVVAIFLIKRRNIEGFDFACGAVYAMIGAILGAKLLFLLVSIDQVKMVIESSLTVLEKVEILLKGGFVFYGGLIGGILGLLIYGWQFKTKMASYFDVCATVLPLGHAFGRVGCFFGGCCYGIEHDGWFSHVYGADWFAQPDKVITPIGVPLLPVQLIEAMCLLALFAGLMVLFFKNKKKTPWLQTLAYMGAYSVIRFVLEFFRGDKERGGFLGVSTSQWISILLVIAGVLAILYLTVWSKKKAVPADGETTETEDESEQESTVEKTETDEISVKEETLAEEMSAGETDTQ